MSAILREAPPELSVTNQSISPGLERIVRHCLEKNPEQRFHSVHDLAFALQALSGSSTPALPAAAPRRRLPGGIRVAALGLAALGAGLVLRRVTAPAPHDPPEIQPLTYSRHASEPPASPDRRPAAFDS